VSWARSGRPRYGRKYRQPPRRGTSRVFSAFFAGQCELCGELFFPGTLVCYDRHHRLVHDNCVMPQQDQVGDQS
jgi:hypothetical protein